MASSSIIQPEGPVRSPEWCPLISQRLREARVERELTLRSLASQIGVSASLISQIETGKVQPSVNTLYALANQLELSLDDLLFPENRVDEPTLDDVDPVVGEAPLLPMVVRASERQGVNLDDGVRWERLTPQSEVGRDFLEIVYEAGGESGPAGHVHRHEGREWGLVIAGVLHIELGDHAYRLEAGDSINFASTTPHRLYNPGPDTMRAVWFVLGRAGDARIRRLPEASGDRPPPDTAPSDDS